MLITIKRLAPLLFSLIIMFLLPTLLYWESDVSGEAAPSSPTATDDYQGCVNCHRTLSPALVKEWEISRHAQLGIGCVSCHGAEKSDPDAWTHEGTLIATLVTPKDCGRCHPQQQQEFSGSHHAKAGEILASLDNILAERVAGMPGNVADAVSGCWQCHGSIVKFKKNKEGQVIRVGKDNKPVLDPNTWPNSGMGRLNPDGSKGSCHACHSRHAFQAKLARAPENCGKCHLGPDHPQIEIYNESKHGIAFYTNRERMALNEQEWVLGRDYSAAPTCTTCHMGAHMTPDGVAFGSSH
ncbi:MAG TPA: multiheme c-type cytochrome, partial [Terriglobales bacterium]|nr:multiheme c-type cytochrome [Terriglobales bacterium]